MPLKQETKSNQKCIKNCFILLKLFITITLKTLTTMYCIILQNLDHYKMIGFGSFIILFWVVSIEMSKQGNKLPANYLNKWINNKCSLVDSVQ